MAIVQHDENGNPIAVGSSHIIGDTLPIGSIINIPGSTVPAGWAVVDSEPERIYVGSQVIFPGLSGNTLVTKTNLIGSYQYMTIDGVFANVTIPTGYHKEYRITFQGTTGGDTTIKIWLNNISSGGLRTWSQPSYRVMDSTDFFKESDVTLETTMNYSALGCNLKYEVLTAATAWQFWNVTVHGYIVCDS